jgi:hypothetical protein
MGSVQTSANDGLFHFYHLGDRPVSECKLDEVGKMLDIVTDQGFMNANTSGARKIAVSRLAEVLEEENRTCDYFLNHTDIVKHRFINLNDKTTGSTAEVYVKRAVLAINDFLAWKADKAAWEKMAASKGAKSDSGEKKAKVEKQPKLIAEAIPLAKVPEGMQEVKIPIRPGVQTKHHIPEDLKLAEVRRIAYVLAGYASDFDPMMGPKEVFKQLEEGGNTVN